MVGVRVRVRVSGAVAPLLQQLGTSGALLGKAHLGQSAVELLARSAPAAGSTGSAAGASFALLASLLAW